MPNSTTPNHSTPRAALAACAAPLRRAGSRVHILPDGAFRSADGSGRPAECAAWQMGPATAARLIAALAARPHDTVVDYEHALLLSKSTGQEVPAAAWWGNGLEYVPGEGLYATNVAWCSRAEAMIDSGEYRYVSPLFYYDETTGEVLSLVNFTLTNDPALPDLDPLAVAALAAALSPPPSQEPAMDPNEIMERLIYVLSLPITTTAEALAGELDKVKAMILAKPAAAAAIPQLDSLVAALSAQVAARGAQLAALSAQTAQTPDPAKWVPMDLVHALQGKVAELSARIDGKELADLVEVGLSDGRILPEMEAWARAQPLAALSAYLESARPIAALAGRQTQGRQAPPAGPAALSEADLAVCATMGLSQDDYRKTMEGN